MVKYAYLLGDEDRAKAVTALETWLDTANDPMMADKLRNMLNENFPNCESTYLSLKHNDASMEYEMSDEDIPTFVVDILGVELLEGAHGKRLRDMILEKIFQKNKNMLRRLSIKKIDPEDWNDDKAAELLDDLKREKWTPGARWARHFVSMLGFPLKPLEHHQKNNRSQKKKSEGELI